MSAVASSYDWRVASTAARLLGDRPHRLSTLARSWRHLPTGGALPSSCLDDGVRMLCSLGLAEVDGEWVQPHRCLRDIVFDEFTLCAPPGDLYAEPACASKLDPEELRRIGLAGELEVLRQCRSALIRQRRGDLADRVLHVALLTDAAGYDIWSPSLPSGELRLEVKTVARGPDLAIYLTRHEAEVAARRPEWRLVVCTFADEVPAVLGWMDYSRMAGRLPSDPHAPGRWEVARLQVLRSEVTAGLPLR